MACILNSGFTTECLEGSGGISEIFVANWDNFNSGITLDVVTGEIDALPTATLYRYVGLKNSMGHDDTPTPNAENGTYFVQQKVGIRVGGLSAAKSKEIQVLARAKMIIFVRTNQNKILCIGKQNGAYLSGGSGGSGKALGDFHGYELEFTAEEPTLAIFVEAYTALPFDNFAGITLSPAY